MKTKLNRILSALLLSVMIFSAVSVCMPIVASAAASESYVAGVQATTGSAADIVKDALENDRTAAASLAYDIGKGYVDSYTNGTFTIYVNRYTGVLYYKNEISGQILTSNPTDPELSAKTGASAKKLLSQVTISLFENSNTTKVYTYDSTTEAAERGQISVSAIKNGLRVNYAIGITSNRYLLPNKMTAERFHEEFLEPFVREISRQWTLDFRADKMDSEYNKVFYQYSKNDGSVNEDGTYNHLFVVKYIGSILQRFSDRDLNKKTDKMYQLLQCYSQDADGNYVLNSNLSNALKNEHAKRVHDLRPDYDYDAMYADEKAAGYVQQVENIPVVRLAVEYTLNADGTLNASLPANSIVYDESFYTLDYVNVLQYFGAGKMLDKEFDANGNVTAVNPVNGYLFYPDGSGMILDFADFGGQSFKLENNIYGMDSAFSSTSGTINYRGESISMPVYGMVSDMELNGQTVTGGFFAIMEEGAAMSTLAYAADASSHNYLYVYPTYKPYPADEYNLSSTISVGGLGKYIIVSDSKYTGSYNTRYVMLSDPSLEALVGEAYCEASYVGMANYYRNYLKANGTLTAITDSKSTLPLYIEAFGAMDVMDRFLTFPVTTSIPLTTFDDVASMYAELKAEGVKNINFRLTGFANGGMSATYPVKSRWAKACGGASDFKALLKTAASESTGDQNFALFPEFDFMYISHSSTFDGMSVKGNVSCMVDNRYASKQVYNSILGGYENFISLVITPDRLTELYSKFQKKYSKYDIQNLSVSTMGTDLNSNFDKKNSINREQAKDYVASALAAMKEEYNLMLDGGNAYTLKYASHILNISTDSSHYRYSSYTVPFVGMILHSYVSYAGSPLNYAGNADYDALRFIESGAAPYYILAYQEQNTKKLKEDENLNKYYGVTYATWKSSVVEMYKYINGAIGGLQDYEITNHQVLIAERVWDASEIEKTFAAQEDIFFTAAKASINAQIADKLETMNTGDGLKVTIDRDTLLGIFLDASQRDENDAQIPQFKADLEAFCAAIEDNYNGTAFGGAVNELSIAAFDVDFSFYVTDSEATDKGAYKSTNYTVDNGNVVMVTYTKGTEKVNFILNYNSYAVTVRLNGEVLEVGSYAYRIY